MTFHVFVVEEMKMSYSDMRCRYLTDDSRMEFYYINDKQMITFKFEYMKYKRFDAEKTQSYSFDYWDEKVKNWKK